MPTDNTYISAVTPITDERTPNIFARTWFRFFDLVAKKVKILDGTITDSASAGTANPLPPAPAGYMTLVNPETGGKVKVAVYNE